MQSSIFLRNITCMDHAWIDNEGHIHGGSFHISCTVTGEVTADESVVIDFSKCKKQLKALIDDPNTGMDHKLLLYPTSLYERNDLYGGRMEIVTPFVRINCPNDAICIMPHTHYLGKYLTMEMSKLYPEANIHVAAKATADGFSDYGTYFTYSHGLKNSSSWGCQNQNHGHCSFVEVDHDPRLQADIAEYLDDAVLINRENIVMENDELIMIEYDPLTREGFFRSTYYKGTKYIVLDTETTIEYIIEHVREKFADRLKGKILRISEGLQKGAEIRC